MTVLVTGATGNVGSAVMRELLERGAAVRAFVRDPAAAREGLAAAGMPDWLVGHLDGAFALIRDGAFEETTDTVRVITGREAHSFAEFARDHRATFAPVGGRAQAAGAA